MTTKSGGSYKVIDGEPVLQQRSGHKLTQPQLKADKKKVAKNENTEKSTTGRG